MAYPASVKTLSQWIVDIDSQARMLKTQAQSQHNASAVGALNMDQVRQFFNHLVHANVFFISAATVPGLAAYMNAEKQGQAADAVAEFVTMRNAVVATLNWLRANVPQASFGGQSYKLAFQFPPDNTTPSTALTFTDVQTAAYRTVLNTLIATVS